MELLDKIKSEVIGIWKIEKNRTIIKDVALLSAATLFFHFLYWHTNMNSWIFGPFTQEVYDFFRHLAFDLSLIPCSAFIDRPFDIVDTEYRFYHLNSLGVKIYSHIMIINADCSAVKQLLQFLLIVVLARGMWWKKGLYFIGGSVIILFFNAVRIYLLTSFFVIHAEQFQFIHDWVARPMMYVIIFSLWLVWITYFANKKKKTSKVTQ